MARPHWRQFVAGDIGDEMSPVRATNFRQAGDNELTTKFDGDNNLSPGLTICRPYRQQ